MSSPSDTVDLPAEDLSPATISLREALTICRALASTNRNLPEPADLLALLLRFTLSTIVDLRSRHCSSDRAVRMEYAQCTPVHQLTRVHLARRPIGFEG